MLLMMFPIGRSGLALATRFVTFIIGVCLELLISRESLGRDFVVLHRHRAEQRAHLPEFDLHHSFAPPSANKFINSFFSSLAPATQAG